MTSDPQPSAEEWPVEKFLKKALSDEGQPMPYQRRWEPGSIVLPISNPTPEAIQRVADLMGKPMEWNGKTYHPKP